MRLALAVIPGVHSAADAARVLHCAGCGACCRHMTLPPFATGEDESRLPTDVKTELDAARSAPTPAKIARACGSAPTAGANTTPTAPTCAGPSIQAAERASSTGCSKEWQPGQKPRRRQRGPKNS